MKLGHGLTSEYKNPEVRKEYRRNWTRKARSEGRISKGGIKYEASKFWEFKGNFEGIQIRAKSLYRSEANSERQAALKAVGVEVSRWRTGRDHLEKNHDCTKLCNFYGHSETWVDIEPVVYKLHLHSGGDFAGFKVAYWIFKRYLVVERELDFPEVRPVFKCSQCGFEQTFQHVDDMFVFQHKCPQPVDSLDEVRDVWFHFGNESSIPYPMTLRKLYAFLGMFHSTTGYGGMTIGCEKQRDRDEWFQEKAVEEGMF